jgi:hypothetical protein
VSSDSRPKGIVTGRTARMLTGFNQFSNCAARIRYMNNTLSTSAIRKYYPVSPSNLAWPPKVTS